MVFEANHFPYSKAVHPSSSDLASLIREGKDVGQALCLNLLAFDLIFRINNNRNQ